MEQPHVAQRPLQGRLHLHSAKLLDGEVQVRLGLREHGLAFFRALSDSYGICLSSRLAAS